MSGNKNIICSVCGAENASENSFCGSCGAKLETGTKLTAEQSKKKKIENKKRDKKSRHIKETEQTKKVSTIKLLYFVLGLVLIGVINLYLSGVFNTPAYIAPTEQSSLPDLQPKTDLAKLQEMNELEKSVESNPNDYDKLLELAHTLNDSGFYQRAIDKYNLYLKARPNEPDVLVDLGVCYYQLNDNKNAIATMEKAIKINPDHQIGNFNLGIVYFADNNINEAVKWWKKAAELNPNSSIGIKAKELINKHQ